MATYVISDIHGFYNRFMDLLNKVRFNQEKDELYILGDICDRGPHNKEMLEWAYEQSSNIHFLYGNHDDFLVTYMRKWEDFIQSEHIYQMNSIKSLDAYKYDFAYNNLWIMHNGGIGTFDYLTSLPKSKREDIVDWIESWPLYYDINVNGQRYILVHAGLAPRGIRMGDTGFEGGRRETVEIDGLERPQYSQAMLWIRDNWFFTNTEDLPFTTIFGHTHTAYIYDMLIWEPQDKEGVKGEPGKILKFGTNKIAIDTGRRVMGMLRLDDMEEFYSDVEED